MMNNYYILKELAKHLNKDLSSHNITEFFSQEKDTLVILFSGQGNEIPLIFSCEKNNPFLLLRDSYSKAKKNTVLLFKSFTGLTINKIFIDISDRLIYFEADNEIKLIFCFAPGKENLLITKEGIILESFKDNISFKGTTLNDYVKPKQPKENEFTTVKEYFKKYYIKFGKTYFNEVLYKLNLKLETALSEDLKKNIDLEFKILLDKFRNPEFILYSKNDELIMSLTALSSYENNYTEIRYNNINELINEYVKRKQRQKLIINTKDKKLIELESDALKIDSKINNLRVRLNESLDSIKFMDYGNYILEHLSIITHGQEYLELDAGDNKIKIKLDTSLSPAMNAQKYFQKYKRQKESVSLLKVKIDKYQKEKNRISEEIIKYSKMSDYKELKSLSKSISKEKEEDETSRFRKFILNEDYQVWVGKDSRSNDLLTVKYSAPNDLWFHIRGTSGSHTVLKTGNKNENIDKRIIETAASICAYYSKARNAGTVPVAFCMKKYVKKRKGFKEGSVVMEREKVIFVKPKLPEGSEDISK